MTINSKSHRYLAILRRKTGDTHGTICKILDIDQSAVYVYAYLLCGRVGRENILLEVMEYGPSAARSLTLIANAFSIEIRQRSRTVRE